MSQSIRHISAPYIYSNKNLIFIAGLCTAQPNTASRWYTIRKSDAKDVAIARKPSGTINIIHKNLLHLYHFII